MKEKLLMFIGLIAICMMFAFMLYAADAGTWKELIVGLIGAAPSAATVIYISNNMITYEEED